MTDGHIAHRGGEREPFGDYLATKRAKVPNGNGIHDGAHEAVEHLQWLDPTGRHNLVGLDPDKRAAPEGRTFEAGRWAEIAEWIRARNGRLNLYYSVNEPRPSAPHKKLGDADIGAIRAVCADLDPRPDEPLDAERDRIRRQVSVPSGSPAIVDSGGGFQAVWRLRDKLDPSEHAAEAKAQGRGIAKALGGDAVIDLARIMRLPGTVNLPDARKQARGRTAALASVVRPGAHTSLSELAAAFPPIAFADAGPDADAEIEKVRQSLDMAAIRGTSSLDDLDAAVRARIAQLIATDEHFKRLWAGDPSAVGPDKSGSGFRAALATALARASGFGAQQYGEVLYAWPHAVADGQDISEVVTDRTIARDWQRRGAPHAAETYFGPLVAEAPSLWDAAPAPAPTAPDRSALPSIRSLAGLPDVKSIPPRDWLVWPWCPADAVSAIVGAPGVSKSAFALMLAVAIASQVETVLRGAGDLSTERVRKTGPVLIYNREDTRDEMCRRVAGVCIANGIDAFPHQLHIVSGVDERRLVLVERKERGGPILRAPGYEALRRAIRDLGPVLVVLDPLISLSAGLDENSNDDMEHLLAELRLLAASERTTVIVVHHAGKNADRMSGELGASRGASAIAGAVRGGVTLTAKRIDEPPAEGALKGMPPGRYIIAESLKSNYGPRLDPIAYRLRQIDVGNGTGEQAPGDTVVVHEIVDRCSAATTAQQAADARRTGDGLVIANILHEVLGERDAMPLATARDLLADRFRDAGLIRGNTRTAVDNKLSSAIFDRPVELSIDGQTVRISVEQDGKGRTAPRIIRREKIHGIDFLDGLRELFE